MEQVMYIVVFAYIVMIGCSIYLIATGNQVGYAYLVCLCGLVVAGRMVDDE